MSSRRSTAAQGAPSAVAVDPCRPRSWRFRLRQAQRSRWGAPIAAVGLGLIALGVQAARGDVGGGVGSVIVMTGYAVVLVLFGGRSEVVSLMRGDATDERANQIQVKALAMTASVLVPVLVAGFLVELARGAADLEVWTWLCALAGAVFLVSLAVLSRRS